MTIIWIGIFVCIALVCFAFIKSDNCKTHLRDKIVAIIGGVAFFTCITLLAVAVVIGERSKKDIKYEICSLTTISSNKTELGGAFILGVGAIESKSEKETYYYFYRKEKQGGWKLTKASAYDVVIFEDENEKPYYTETTHKKEYDELHLPKNTIKKDINKISLSKIVR